MTVQATVDSTLNGQSADLVLIEDGDSRNYETKTLAGGSETFVFTSLDGGLDKEYTAKIVPSTTDVTATAEVNYGATVEIDPIPHRDVDADATIRETAEFNNGVAAKSLELGDNPLINGLLTSALNDGEVLADDGYVYSSVQAAQDAASSWIFIGPGTFNEATNINTTGLTIVGSGYNTVIDGSSESTDVMDITADNISVSSLRLTNDVGSSYNAVHINSTGCTVSNIFCEGIGSNGFYTTNTDNKVVNSTFDNCQMGIRFENSAHRGTSSSNVVKNSGGAVRIYTSHDHISVNNIVIDISDRGYNIDGGAYDNVIGGNRIHNCTNEGFYIDNPDNIIFNNRVSDCGSNIVNNNSNTLDGNNTGASN